MTYPEDRHDIFPELMPQEPAPRAERPTVNLGERCPVTNLSHDIDWHSIETGTRDGMMTVSFVCTHCDRIGIALMRHVRSQLQWEEA